MIYVFGDCELDDRLYELRRTGVPLDIERKVFDVLAYLLQHRDRVVPKDELLDKLWPGVAIGEVALTRCITAARKALGDDGVRQEIIRTQHGRGYRFVAAVIEQTLERKLAAILSADVKGYSRLMGEDEEATIRTLTAYRELMTVLVQRHRGRVVDSPGDNLLAEFASVVDAVQGAVEIQQELQNKNAYLPAPRRMEFRIGINVGDIVVEAGRIYGDGVNIAARLESLAEGGGICISGTVLEQVKNKLTLRYEDLGEQAVKNIAAPVRVWRIKLEPEAAPGAIETALYPPPAADQLQEVALPLPRPRVWPHKGLVFAAVLLLVGTVLTVHYLSRPTLSTQDSALITQEVQLPLPDKPSIVVLPFVNLSEDPKQEYFSDGLTDVLTGDLSRISSLFVIARNSAFTYKGKAVKVQDVGREMGVRYVLEGSVLKTDEKVRITAQLIDATTGFHLWSEQYDRPLQDIFALQDDIVQKIVTTLRLQLTLQEQGYLMRKHTNNIEAYDAFLHGVAYGIRDKKTEVTVQARPLLEQAIALDQQYAEAYAVLGWTYWAEWVNRWSVDSQTLERAFALAQKAVALDDFQPAAHSLLSLVYALKQQYEQALAEGERAIALDPNNDRSYAHQAQMMNWTGRPEEALRAVKQAMRLNPRYPFWYLHDLGWAYNMTGHYTEAVAASKEAINRSPTSVPAHFNLTVSYMSQWIFQLSQDPQILEQALATAQRLISLNDSNPGGHHLLGIGYLWQKQYEQALAEMERAIALDPNEATGYALLALILGHVGRSEEALQMVEQAMLREPLMLDGHLIFIGEAYALAGKLEEAIAPLRRYLTRYPNFLGAHLDLAAVYSELGKEAEARAEAAEVLRLNPQFSLEVHRQRAPIRDPAMLERVLAALRKAGLK
jgi:adenylate cyclase